MCVGTWDKGALAYGDIGDGGLFDEAFRPKMTWTDYAGA
jgi:hypothetical protein